MSCTYLYKNKKVKSYQKLVELISQDDLKEIASVVFSLETKQNLYDELSRLNETCNFKANRNSFLDDVDIESFDKFIDRHWKNQQKQTVVVNAEVTEEKPKRRRRKPKAASEV